MSSGLSIPSAATLALILTALPGCGGGAATTSQASGAGGASTGSSVSAGDSSAAAGTGGSSSTGSAGSGGVNVVPDPGPSTFAVADIDQNRNRTLDTYARHRGALDRCTFWAAMTIVEKGIFLTHTDMLGHRSCLENADVPAAQMGNGACTPGSCSCLDAEPCSCAVGSAMALDHVFSIWAINGSDTSCCAGVNCCNGGGEWHRTFFSADDRLIAYYRDINAGLPEWAQSNDFKGPHAPFTQSSETVPGSPRGQTHFWKADGDASTLQRNGVVGVVDPHVVEIDNDYNFIHDSSPEGYYSSTYGRAEYKRNWSWPSDAGKNRGDGLPTTFGGNGAPSNISELAGDDTWSPSCAAPVVTAVTGSAGIHPGGAIVIAGSGFLAAGNRIFVRTRSMAVALDAKTSKLVLAEATDHLDVQLPKDIGTGEGFVYVQIAGVITNVLPVTIAP
ncbi:MAG: hypothetical protein ABJE95_00590 [Byssovorax sp.]